MAAIQAVFRLHLRVEEMTRAEFSPVGSTRGVVAGLAYVEAKSPEVAKTLGIFDIRTEGNIQTLQPEARRRARQFLTEVAAHLSVDDLIF
jgi:hypothetical protein